MSFELLPAGRSLRYSADDEAFAAASAFGGRWRITDLDGTPLLSLAASGSDGSDDRLVVPTSSNPWALILKDRRHPGTWLVRVQSDAHMIHAVDDDLGGIRLFTHDGEPLGRIVSTTMSLEISYTDPRCGLGHCLGLALPLYFVVTRVLAPGALPLSPR